MSLTVAETACKMCPQPAITDEERTLAFSATLPCDAPQGPTDAEPTPTQKHEDDAKDKQHEGALLELVAGLKKLWEQLQTPSSEPAAAEEAGATQMQSDVHDQLAGAESEQDTGSTQSGDDSSQLSVPSTDAGYSRHRRQPASGSESVLSSNSDASAAFAADNEVPDSRYTAEPLTPASMYSRITAAASPIPTSPNVTDVDNAASPGLYPIPDTPHDTAYNPASPSHHNDNFLYSAPTSAAQSPGTASRCHSGNDSLARPRSPRSPTYDAESLSRAHTEDPLYTPRSIASSETPDSARSRASSMTSAATPCTSAAHRGGGHWASSASLAESSKA